MPEYRLLSETGDDLGPFRTSHPSWQPGDLIPVGASGGLVVVNVTEAGELDEFDAYLVVKPQ